MADGRRDVGGGVGMRDVARKARRDADWRRRRRLVQRGGSLWSRGGGRLAEFQRGGDRMSDWNPGWSDCRRDLRLFVDPVAGVGRARNSAASANPGATGFTAAVDCAAISGAAASAAPSTNINADPNSGINADPNPGINVNLDPAAADRRAGINTGAAHRKPDAPATAATSFSGTTTSSACRNDNRATDGPARRAFRASELGPQWQ